MVKRWPMHPRVAIRAFCGLLFTAASVHADGMPRAGRDLPAISILPHGSVLEGVMLPRYDEKRRLTSSLKTRVMTLVNDERVDGEDVTLEMYHPDGASKALVRLAHASLNQGTGYLTASESVNITADRLTAHGTGIFYHLARGRGFLLGPAETRIQPATIDTTMKNTPSPLRATAALGLALVATGPLAASPPVAVSAEELTALHAAAANREAEVGALATAAIGMAVADAADAAKASDATREFIEDAGIPPVGDEAGPEAKPLEIQPGPNDTLIQCDGGMYFDAKEGVLVYLKNVRVTDPRFNLSGANELKIFFEKKPEAAGDGGNEKEASAEGFGAGFGEVERIIATGAVRILQKSAKPGEAPVEASGGLFTYHTGTGEIIISGRYPWVKKGDFYARAKQPNLTLRIKRSGEFVTEGSWDMGGNLNPNR
jgi:hypothetical protein